MLNRRGGVARMLQVLTEQILSIGVVGLEGNHLIQELGSLLRSVFLFCREREEIERLSIIRLQMNCALQFLVRLFILAGLEEESAQIVMSRGKCRLQPSGFRKFLTPAGALEP